MNCLNEIKRELECMDEIKKRGEPLYKNKNDAKWVRWTKMTINAKWERHIDYFAPFTLFIMVPTILL